MEKGPLTIPPEKSSSLERPWGLFTIPPFPPVALGVLQLVTAKNTQLDQVSKLICADHAFSTEVLKIANSPLYASGQIRSVLHATALMGIERLKGIAITVGVRAYLNDSLHLPVLRACWRHSLACAFIAEQLAVAELADKDIAYTAGILHDIGRLALAVMHPKRYFEFSEIVGQGPGDILQREREWFEVDHCAVGRLLVSAWGLPSDFAEITSGHHNERNSAKFDLLTQVCFGCRLADALGFAAVRSFSPKKYEDLLAEIPVHQQGRLGPDPQELKFQIASKINSVESISTV